jgi:hypothetical protein
MRFPLLFLSLLLAGAAVPLSGAETITALAAVKLLPRDKAAKLARIEARDGTPEPDRWYLLVHDVAEESGVHEYVIAGKEIVASRGISQFADTLKPEDVMGTASVKIDSDRAAKLARQYAQANGVSISKMNYELKREGSEAAPAWKVSCLDETGAQVGEITVTAGKGNVISHEGFAVAPQPTATPAPEPKKAEAKKKPAPKFDVYADSQVAPGAVAPTAAPNPEPLPEDEGAWETRERRRSRGDSDRGGGAVGNAARNVGRTIRRLLPF